eukprot:15475093-Alexandrium_andersonii.AAC.1
MAGGLKQRFTIKRPKLANRSESSAHLAQRTKWRKALPSPPSIHAMSGGRELQRASLRPPRR